VRILPMVSIVITFIILTNGVPARETETTPSQKQGI
jgi:hypothetical protein